MTMPRQPQSTWSWSVFKFRCLAASAALLALAPLPTSARAERVPTLSEIIQTHRKIHEDLTQVFVKWSMTPQLFVELETAKRIDSRQYYHSVSTQSAFQGPKRYYDHDLRTLFGAKMPATAEIARMAMTYDGETTRILERRPIYGDDKMVDLARIWPGNEARQFFTYDNFLAFHGMPKVPGYRLFIGSKLANLDLVALLEGPGFRVEPALVPAQDGTPCVVVSSADERIWLDPGRNLAVRQHDWSMPGPRGLVSRVCLGDHVELVPGVWLAKKFHRDLMPDPVAYPELAGKPYIVEQCEVTELAPRVTDAMFHLALPPSTQVSDMTRIPKLVKGGFAIVAYTIPTTPADLAEIIRVSTVERLQAEQRARSADSLSIAFVAVNAAAVVCLILLAWRKYQRGDIGLAHEGR